LIDDEVDRIIRDAHRVAKRILTKNKERLVHIAEKLIVQETIEGEELEATFTEPLDTKIKAPAPTTPQAEKAPPKAKAKPATRKTRISPQIIPKQAPASP